MPHEIAFERSPALPPLAWLLTLDRGGRTAWLRAGNAVERVGDRFLAGAWSGAFADGGMAGALTATGTGIDPTTDPLTIVCGTASAEVVYVHRFGDRMVVGNLLPLLLAAAGDRPRRDYPSYSNDMFTIYFGSARYRSEFPMERGVVSLIFSSFTIDNELNIRRLPLPVAPPFADFAAYKSFLVEQTKAVFANAADPARSARYRPITAVTSGYDAPASAAIAREAGCTESYTFRQSTTGGGASDDSGEPVARDLGLKVAAFDTFAYRERDDFPEPVFASAGFGGGQVHHAGNEDFFRERLVVGGGGGDNVWSRTFRLRGIEDLPFYLGGYSGTKFFLGLPALKLDIPAIGLTRFDDIGRISRSPEMQAWSVGGFYDRPIARRFAEEAGVSRDHFGRAKLRVAHGFENPRPKGNALETYLSERSLADFKTWYEAANPLSRSRVAWHNFRAATVGRIVWSKKLAMRLRKAGIQWPRDSVGSWHLLSPLRPSAYVFHWAVEREIEKYDQALEG
jgi:hypothetical protein